MPIEMSGTRVRTPPFTPRRSAAEDQSGLTVAEIAEGSSGALDAVAVGAAALPGFLLTVPGLVLVLAPLVAIGVVAAAAGAVILVAAVAAVVGWRVARGAGHALAALRVPRALTVARHRQPAGQQLAARGHARTRSSIGTLDR